MKRKIKNLLIRVIAILYNKYKHIFRVAKGKAEYDRVKNKIKFIGYGVKFNGKITITNPECLELGNNVHIGDNAYIRAGGGVIIEDNCHISRNLILYTENHDYKGVALPYDNEIINKPVYIEKNVWIGHNVSILPGIKIGEGSIIGLGTVVTKDLPPLSIVGHGHPNIIKSRDKNHYEELDLKQKYGGVGGKPLNFNEINEFKNFKDK